GYSRTGRKVDADKEVVKVHLFQSPSTDDNGNSVEVDIRIPIKKISFLHKDDIFEASVEYSIFTFDMDENLMQTKIWKQTYVEEVFHNTKSESKHLAAATTLNVPPGEYELLVKAVDFQNNDTYSNKTKLVSAAHDSGTTFLSDLRLVTIADDEEHIRHVINPFLDEEIPEHTDSLFIYFKALHNGDSAISGSLSYQIVNSAKDVQGSYEGEIILEPGISEHTIPLSTSNLVSKNYTIKLTIESDTLSLSREYPIHIAWLGISRYINDIDMAIDQTRFVATRTELKKMREAKGDGERRDAFLNFWKTRDPTPGTEKNELMDEYYARVAYSNRKYRGLRPGWETDFGMVFIIHGPPDEIENYPFEDNRKPYQVWRYYNRNWQFVFVDQQMYGDFRLVTPLYPSGL
ncbi:GWxTD domain-containing protein, partial [Candidatus Neomarinimicrobiota bacterium]